MKILLMGIAFLPLFCIAQTTTNSPYGCEDSLYAPVNQNEMRIFYLSAMSKDDGYSLLWLARIQNEHQFLTDIKAGNILKEAYRIGIANQDPALLYNIGIYENIVGLMVDLKAGDILYEAYRAAMIKKNASLLFKIAAYENDNNVMDAKAGDILYEAYRTALSNKDISTLYKIANYEQLKDIMKLTSEEIIREISKLSF
jgi:hypothetical protein